MLFNSVFVCLRNRSLEENSERLGQTLTLVLMLSANRCLVEAERAVDERSQSQGKAVFDCFVVLTRQEPQEMDSRETFNFHIFGGLCLKNAT